MSWKTHIGFPSLLALLATFVPPQQCANKAVSRDMENT